MNNQNRPSFREDLYKTVMDFPRDGSPSTLTHLSLERWRALFQRRALKSTMTIPVNPNIGGNNDEEENPMLFLWLNQALELLDACRTPVERLVIRYPLLNGLSTMEITNGNIEHLDPLSCTLFLPKRHWKRNCTTDIDPETVRLQVMYSGDRISGPLLLAPMGGRLNKVTVWTITKRVAKRTTIPHKELISPRILKRTFAREWLLAQGGIGTLQKQLSHKHLASTAHYTRFVMEDVKPDHARMLARARGEQP